MKKGRRQLPIPNGLKRMQVVNAKHPGRWSKVVSDIYPHPWHRVFIIAF
jgi:hypothetical protein